MSDRTLRRIYRENLSFGVNLGVSMPPAMPLRAWARDVARWARGRTGDAARRWLGHKGLRPSTEGDIEVTTWSDDEVADG